jgi:CBS domain-containing protein
MSSHSIIFVSYSRQDAPDFARKLNNSLEMQGYETFFDKKDIVLGTDWEARLKKALKECTHLIAILTPHSIKSDYCKIEWESARSLSIPIVPILYKTYIPSDDPVDFISKLQYLDFRDDMQYESNINELINGINELDIQPSIFSHDWRYQPVIDFATPTDKVLCISPESTIREAYHMIEKGNFAFRHLIVTHSGKNDGELIGIIGLRSIINQLSNPYHDISEMRVSEIMINFNPTPQKEREFAWLRRADTIEDALHAFNQRVSSRRGVGLSQDYFTMPTIPIIDNDNHVFGIISAKQVLFTMLKGKLPTPDGIIYHYIGRTSHVISYPTDTISFVKEKFLRLPQRDINQRDIPVVDDNQHLIGLVLDHVFITNYHKDVMMKDIMTPLKMLKLQTPTMHFEDILREYMNGYSYDSFPVVKSRNNLEFVGLFGYHDIFRALLAM